MAEKIKNFIKLYYIPENKRDRSRPGIGSITLDREKAPSGVYPVLSDNIHGLMAIGLDKVGKIDVFVMDTYEEAAAVHMGLRDVAKKYTDVYKDPRGFGMVLMCDQSQEFGISLTDYRKPASEYGMDADRSVPSWKMTSEEFSKAVYTDEELEVYLDRFGRRLAEMANDVGSEALDALRTASADLVEEQEMELSGRAMAMGM